MHKNLKVALATWSIRLRQRKIDLSSRYCKLVVNLIKIRSLLRQLGGVCPVFVRVFVRDFCARPPMWKRLPKNDEKRDVQNTVENNVWQVAKESQREEKTPTSDRRKVALASKRLKITDLSKLMPSTGPTSGGGRYALSRRRSACTRRCTRPWSPRPSWRR